MARLTNLVFSFINSKYLFCAGVVPLGKLGALLSISETTRLVQNIELIRFSLCAGVVKLVDTLGLGPSAFERGGSSPFSGTIQIY